MSTSVAVRENPYTIGVPVAGEGSFFGREEIFENVRAYLLERAPVTVIRGQRRIGKSSVLRRIELHLDVPEHSFVPFDLQAAARWPLGELLWHLGSAIAERVPQAPPIPPATDLDSSPSLFVSQFLEPALKEYAGTLVLLLDELDALGFQTGPDSRTGDGFGSMLSFAVGRLQNLRAIAVIGRNMDQLDRLPSNIQSAPQQPLGLLDAGSAERLIRLPARGILQLDSGAVDAIQLLACGHPYFTQLLCFSVFHRAKTLDRWVVSAADVEAIVPDAMVRGRGGLAWFRDGLPTNERVIFSAYAEAAGDPAGAAKLLLQRGLVRTDELGLADRRLREWGYLRRDGLAAVELVRRWICQEYPLREELRELEKADPEADVLHRKSREQKAADDIAGQKQSLRACLRRNPNHVRGLADLAAALYQSRDLAEAAELYRRAWRMNPSLGDEFVETLLAMAREAITRSDARAVQSYLAEAQSVDPKSEAVALLLQESSANAGILARVQRFLKWS